MPSNRFVTEISKVVCGICFPWVIRVQPIVLTGMWNTVLICAAYLSALSQISIGVEAFLANGEYSKDAPIVMRVSIRSRAMLTMRWWFGASKKIKRTGHVIAHPNNRSRDYQPLLVDKVLDETHP
jgi:hypothetical protein